MASTASDLLKFEKMATGEKSGTWGALANTALSRVEEAIADVTNISLHAKGGANYTLSDVQYNEHNDGANTSESHCAAIKATGTLNAAEKIIVPLRNKIYWVWNATSGAHAVTVGGSSGGVIEIPQGYLAAVICDGTNVEALTPPISVTGVLTLYGRDLVLDADGDTKIVASTDDQINVTIGGVLEMTLTAAKADNLDDLSALGTTNSNFIVGDGTNWVAETGATARTSLGLGDAATGTVGSEVQAYDVDTLKADTDDVLAACFSATWESKGNTGTASIVPAYTTSNYQYWIVNGAFTLNDPTSLEGALLIKFINSGVHTPTFHADLKAMVATDTWNTANTKINYVLLIRQGSVTNYKIIATA